jgi:L-rhamnose mutarotase
MADPDTETTAYLQRIDPDHAEAYRRAHDDVPAAVTDAMERAGVVDFRLFVRGDVAVCVLEAEDLDAYFDAMDDDPDVREWERHVSQFKREGVDVDAEDGAAVPFMDEVWSYAPDDGE